MSQPLLGKKKAQAEKFYDKLLTVLIKHRLPFMIGGTFAFNEYTGLNRATGDIDIMITRSNHPKVLKTLSDNGYKTELVDIGFNWLAKVVDEDGFYTDLIFGERNGLHTIDDSWLKRAREGTILGHKVKLEPVEEMILSKSYIQSRIRHDGGDVVHLLLTQGKNLNWKILMEKMEPHWELLLAHIMTFLFIYPSERGVIPKWVIDELSLKLEARFGHPPTKDKITRGLLLSEDYEVGISHWGFKPVTGLK